MWMCVVALLGMHSPHPRSQPLIHAILAPLCCPGPSAYVVTAWTSQAGKVNWLKNKCSHCWWDHSLNSFSTCSHTGLFFFKHFFLRSSRIHLRKCSAEQLICAISSYSSPLKLLVHRSCLFFLFLPQGCRSVMAFQYLKETYKKEGDRPFSRVCCDRRRGNSFKQKEGKFYDPCPRQQGIHSRPKRQGFLVPQVGIPATLKICRIIKSVQC